MSVRCKLADLKGPKLVMQSRSREEVPAQDTHLEGAFATQLCQPPRRAHHQHRLVELQSLGLSIADTSSVPNTPRLRRHPAHVVPPQGMRVKHLAVYVTQRAKLQHVTATWTPGSGTLLWLARTV